MTKHKCITITILINIVSVVQNSIKRQLVEETEEQRMWCVVSYVP